MTISGTPFARPITTCGGVSYCTGSPAYRNRAMPLQRKTVSYSTVLRRTTVQATVLQYSAVIDFTLPRVKATACSLSQASWSNWFHLCGRNVAVVRPDWSHYKEVGFVVISCFVHEILGSSFVCIKATLSLEATSGVALFWRIDCATRRSIRGGGP